MAVSVCGRSTTQRDPKKRKETTINVNSEIGEEVAKVRRMLNTKSITERG
jgi:hypothetical protein